MEPSSLQPTGRGINNLGNTCYLNSAIQIMAAIPEFQPENPKSPLHHLHKTHPLVIKWAEIVKALLPAADQLMPADQLLQADSPQIPQPLNISDFLTHLVRHAKTKTFNIATNEPQDAAEFFQFLTEEFHTILAHSVEASVQGQTHTATDLLAKACYETLAETYRASFSEFYPLCYGVSVSSLVPLSTVTQSALVQSEKTGPTPPPVPLSIKPETFFILHCPLPPCPPFQKDAPVTLCQCLDQISRPEILEGDNAWFDESVGYKRPVQKQFCFWNFPPILAITLQRIMPDGTKDQRVVEIPITLLDLEPYMCGYGKHRAKYELAAVALHHGGLHDGHYTAIVKKCSGTSVIWEHYNDHAVQIFAQYPLANAEEAAPELAKALNHPSVYMLLYRRI